MKTRVSTLIALIVVVVAVVVLRGSNWFPRSRKPFDRRPDIKDCPKFLGFPFRLIVDLVRDVVFHDCTSTENVPVGSRDHFRKGGSRQGIGITRVGN